SLRLVCWLAVRAPFRRVGALRCRADVLSDAIAVGHPCPTKAPTRRNGAWRLEVPTSLVAQLGVGGGRAKAKPERKPRASFCLSLPPHPARSDRSGKTTRLAPFRWGGGSVGHGWPTAVASAHG